MPSDTAAHVARGLEGSHTRPGGVVLPGGECTAHHGRPDMGGDTVTESCGWRLSARALREEARGDPRNPTPAVRPRPTLRPSSPRKPQVATHPDDKVTIWGARTIPCAGRSPPEALPSWGHFCWGGQARTRALHALTFTWREKRQQPAACSSRGEARKRRPGGGRACGQVNPRRRRGSAKAPRRGPVFCMGAGV